MCRNDISAVGETRVSLGMTPSRLFLWILALLTALALRTGRGYRPFPAPDDLAYVPLVWAAGNPALYPRDTLSERNGGREPTRGRSSAGALPRARRGL